MRIAQVCRIGPPHVGGMERVVAGLSAALQARGHEVEVFTLDRAIPTGEPLPEGLVDGVRTHRLPRVGPRRYPFARGLVPALRGFDLVHVHGLDGLADAVVAARPAPVGISTHGGYFHTPRHRLLKALALRTITRRTLRRADAVWFTSQADRERLAPAGAEGVVLAQGVDLDGFIGVPRRPERGRWLVYGRLDVHKGLDDLLEALTGLDVEVDVVGPEARPGLARRLSDRAAALGVRVRFQGALSRDALRPLLERAELALFPSRAEGFGLSVVEVMAAGVPPVVSGIPAFDELVRPGVDGHRVAFRSPARAREALAALLGADHAAVGARAAERARGFAWDRRVRDWEAAYERVIRCASA